MIKIQNIATGEIKKVFQTEVNEKGQIKNNENKAFGKRFINAWTGILTETTDENGQQVFDLSPEWQVVTKGERKPRTPKPEAPKPEADNVPQDTDVHDNDNENDNDNEPKPEAQPKTQENADNAENVDETACRYFFEMTD